MCRLEAARWQQQKPQLDEMGVGLVVIVKENLDTEIDDFIEHAWKSKEGLYMDPTLVRFPLS